MEGKCVGGVEETGRRGTVRLGIYLARDASASNARIGEDNTETGGE